jgi:hypothetical protein
MIRSAGCATLEPCDLLILHVAASAHSEERLQLDIENRHLDVGVFQPAIGADCFLIGRLGFGAVEAGS